MGRVRHWVGGERFSRPRSSGKVSDQEQPSWPSSRREVHDRPNEATFDSSTQMASVSSDRRIREVTSRLDGVYTVVNLDS